jgi:hypothetical protein
MYFKQLPKIIQKDFSGNSVYVTNLLARSTLIKNMLANPLLFYEYNLKDNDTPDIVAYKYYGNVDRFWIVLYANQTMDPQWDWPLNGNLLESYINKKYADPNLAHHYEKLIEQYDSVTRKTTNFVSIIDETTYNNLVPSSNTYNISNSEVTVNINKRVVSFHQYELELNDKKRIVKLLNKDYVLQMEAEFKRLMAA